MKVRIISALVAIAIVALPIYYGGAIYSFLVGVGAILGFKEIIDLQKAHRPFPLVVCILAMTSCLLLIYTNFNSSSLVYGFTYKRLIFTILSLLVPTIIYKNNTYTTTDAFYLIGSVIFLGLAANSFILIRDMGLKVFIYLVIIPISTDTFAYIFGSLIGKHKMCPNISPNKSWEGFVAGLLLGTIIPCIIYYIMFNHITWSHILCTSLLSVAGQIGDIIFSKIKRENGIKDFSNLMPGHGGLLDRLDSSIVIFMTYIFLLTVLF